MRRLISSGSRFEADIGYSRAVMLDGWVFVSGTTGYDYDTMTLPEDVETQCANTLATISRALAEVGCGLDDVVRVRYILPDRQDFPKLWPQLSRAFAKARPAATMIEARLMEDAMKIEIEVTARLPDQPR
ncbi:MAG: RidA family protein [Rhodobacterales bacterium]|nr:RidA family protein [Rhodobacterales bacterium]MDX5499079.1 RidA family protein [Rhodobacterales bacterium]